jgi:glycosyltransferase involved in cell wall biosynthesis
MHNNADEVAVTVPAALDQALPGSWSHEVIAVDDGSDPASAEALDRVFAAHEGPKLRVVRLRPNRGRAGARNAGIAAASGQWIVLLDSDMIVGPGFLAAHAEILAGGADISLGGFVDTFRLAPPGEQPPMGGRRPMGFTSANVGLSRRLLDRLGTDGALFDAETFTRYGWEDLDLERRLAALAPRRARAAGAMGYHICPPFGPEVLPEMMQKERDRAAMARAFLAKHPTWPVRMVTQATPIHRVLWEILSLGGLLNDRSLRPLLSFLSDRGHRGLASRVARLCILNPTYVRSL